MRGLPERLRGHRVLSRVAIAAFLLAACGDDGRPCPCEECVDGECAVRCDRSAECDEGRTCIAGLCLRPCPCPAECGCQGGLYCATEGCYEPGATS